MSHDPKVLSPHFAPIQLLNPANFDCSQDQPLSPGVGKTKTPVNILPTWNIPADKCFDELTRAAEGICKALDGLEKALSSNQWKEAMSYLDALSEEHELRDWLRKQLHAKDAVQS